MLVVLVRGVGFAEINEPPDPANTPDLTPSRSRPDRKYSNFYLIYDR